MQANIFEYIINLIFPKQCISCNAEGIYLCQDCIAMVSVNLAPQKFRGSPLNGLFYAASYQEPLVQKAIRLFKYPPFAKGFAAPLVVLIISHFALANKPILSPLERHFTNPMPKSENMYLCPIPLSKRRLRWRGFNQAEELACHVSIYTGIPVHADILLRTKHTAPQADLSQKERMKNVRDIFTVQNKTIVSGKTIILVDDVYTTGATMREAAKELKRVGAKSVWGIVVARG